MYCFKCYELHFCFCYFAVFIVAVLLLFFSKSVSAFQNLIRYDEKSFSSFSFSPASRCANAQLWRF